MRLPALLACAGLAVAAACARPPAAPEAATPPDQSYALRAVVAGLPGAGKSRTYVELRHEAVPGFVSSAGEVVGMESMTMTFPLAEPAELAGIAVGDKVAFDLEVRWADADPTLVRDLREIPASTVLSFEAPAGATP